MREGFPEMEFNYHTIDWYVEKIIRKDYFAFPGYSDAEWFCILEQRVGNTTGLGQILSPTHGKKLAQILVRRQHDPRWLFALPRCLWRMAQFSNNSIDDFLIRSNIEIEAYERDMVTDDLAESAGLWPLVKVARDNRVVFIGNYDLKPVASVLETDCFVGITSPNLHMVDMGIEIAVANALDIAYGLGS
jgi:hypothetical protein